MKRNLERIKFREIDTARTTLGLEEEASVQEIKRAYRKLSKKYHPDKCTESEEVCRETMQRINWAHEVLMNYVNIYRYSFRKEDVDRHDPEKAVRRFYNDWMWGKGE